MAQPPSSTSLTKIRFQSLSDHAEFNIMQKLLEGADAEPGEVMG